MLHPRARYDTTILIRYGYGTSPDEGMKAFRVSASLRLFEEGTRPHVHQRALLTPRRGRHVRYDSPLLRVDQEIVG